MGMGIKNRIFAVILMMGWMFPPYMPVYAQGQEVFNQSGLPIPRFVSLRSDKVFVRTGPALRYPIKWIFTKENLPVEVVQEFDTWRKIRDNEGAEGWIHQSLLSGKRFAIVTAEKGAYLMRKPVSDARPVVMLEPKVVIALESCSGAWCSAETNGFKGWIEKKLLWGVYDDEELD